MSKRDQLGSNATDSTTGKILPEGFIHAVTSAGNTLYFHGPAERQSFINAHPAQFGKNQGEGDVRGK